jgi:hypothetical protein
MPNPELSAVQLLANQLNALKSTGPRTEEGKNIGKFNARRHGLTGQFYCMSEGDEIAYKAFEASLLQSLNPCGAYETQLAISITQDQWRLNRSRSTEFNLYGQGHEEFADSTLTDSPNIQVASTMADTFREDQRRLRQHRLVRNSPPPNDRAQRKSLAELQSKRQAAEQGALEELEFLIRLADFAGKSLEDVGVIPAGPDAPDSVFIPPATNRGLGEADRHSAPIQTNGSQRHASLVPRTDSRSSAIQANGSQSDASLVPRTDPRSSAIQASGFVFSVPAVRAKMHREDNLKTARLCAERKWDRSRINLEDLPRAA